MHYGLELGMFLEELATSSSFIDKTISLLIFKPTTVYCAVTACHALRSRAGLQSRDRAASFRVGGLKENA